MTNLTRRTQTSSGSRVLLVRQPIRSVRSAHEASPLPVRLAIGVIATVGVVAALWLVGLCGYHLGFTRLIGVPELHMGPGGGLVVAAAMIVSIPMTILRAGMAQPLWLMLGFAALAIPAGGLSAVKPHAPGGPRPQQLTVVASFAGAIAAGLFALVVVWWASSPLRSGLIRPMPDSAASAEMWLANLRLAAGMDVFAAAATASWVVLVMRLGLPRWLRGLVGAAAFTALAIIITAMAVSNVTVSQVTADRSAVVVFEGATADRVLLLGEGFEQLVTLRVSGGHSAVELIERPDRMRVVGQTSIARWLDDHVEPDPLNR